MTDKPATFKHEWLYEPEAGFIKFVQHGTIDEPDAVEIIRLWQRDVPLDEAGFILIDTRNASNLTVEARQLFSKGTPVEVYIAAYGSSVLYRVILTMLFKALTVLLPHFVGDMFSDEVPAREWLTTKRHAYLARKARGQAR
ncbi:MAG TPA: hypothetical protein VM580_24755 [Labilithrix sp.]|nr:hypothetical protein [Labilithrix sp.]